VGGLDLEEHYRRAIEIDPKNVFAHAMWGFQIVVFGYSLAEAKQHFAIALESDRKREYVREMQMSAMLASRTDERQIEAVQLANEIRSRGETMPLGDPYSPIARNLWDIYRERLTKRPRGDDESRLRLQFLAALPPTDHLATFRWLYPDQNKGKEFNDRLYRLLLEQLQEHGGDPAGAQA
jgi:hypothetical protein